MVRRWGEFDAYLYYVIPNDAVLADPDAVKSGIAAHATFAAGNVNLSGVLPQTFTVTMTDASPDMYTIYFVAEGDGGLSEISHLDFTIP